MGRLEDIGMLVDIGIPEDMDMLGMAVVEDAIDIDMELDCMVK